MKTSKCRHTRAVVLWLTLVLFAFMPLADGQTLEVLHLFQQSDGWDPHSPLVQGTDGNFYGTTVLGGGTQPTISTVGPGGWGTVFRMTPAGMLTTLASFNGTNGHSPAGGLVQGDDGDFYGVTTEGG